AAGSTLLAVAVLVGLELPINLSPPSHVGAPPRAPHAAPPSPTIGHAARHRAAGASRGPTTFYVSPDGRDSNPGTSPARPWRTVARVDRAELIPGDVVLFQGGKSFSDRTLMPGQGSKVSGAFGRPIVFGSYGSGRAHLERGIWLGAKAKYPSGPSHLVFEDLALGPEQGFQGTGDYIKLVGLRISHLLGPRGQETGIATEGSHWVIEDNTISDTGDSGMLLGFDAGRAGDPAGGSDYLVSHNNVTHTGLDPRLTYARHAIYLKVADARISDNRLTYFHDDGISMRYRDAMVSHNYIAHGAIGIAWYQYDDRPGTTRLIGNTIAFTDTAAIFVCGVAESCARPIESFVVKHNLMGRSRGEALNLQPTGGTYEIQANSGL
ncbi:MAG TPA: right-handed parallel beta-helix repeat-containing protein, partial [Actinocrinis sp.]